MAKRSQLHRQLMRDLEASQKKKRIFAFGTILDKKHQIIPPKMADIDKWLVCKRVPEHLESMAAVWQGITHLRSTRAYCEYLLDHPEITPPKYLVQMNMLDREALKGQVRFHPGAEAEESGPAIIPKRAMETETEHAEQEALLLGT